MRSLIACLACLLLPACMTSGPIVATPADCWSYIPRAWWEPVKPPPLPDAQTVGDLIVFADQLAGKLDTANGRFDDTRHIVTECEKREREAADRARGGLLRRLF